MQDFLDGDIVSYLINENRNIIEFNSEQGEFSKKNIKVLFLHVI